MALLGMGFRRTALKEDLKFTAAEMVYGTTLRLPGEFFTPSTTDSLPDPPIVSISSKPNSRLFALLHPEFTNDPHTFLMDCPQQHVFIHRDGVQKPLQPPYDGPYPIVKRTDKHFTIGFNGRNDTDFDQLPQACPPRY